MTSELFSFSTNFSQKNSLTFGTLWDKRLSFGKPSGNQTNLSRLLRRSFDFVRERPGAPHKISRVNTGTEYSRLAKMASLVVLVAAARRWLLKTKWKGIGVNRSYPRTKPGTQCKACFENSQMCRTMDVIIDSSKFSAFCE